MIHLLAQCPCSDGGSGEGISQTAVLVLLALAVWLWQAIKWTKRTWNIQGTTNVRRFSKIWTDCSTCGCHGCSGWRAVDRCRCGGHG